MSKKQELSQFILFLMCFSIADGDLSVTPRNAAVLAGNRMEMECRGEIYEWTVKHSPHSVELSILRINVITKQFRHFGYYTDSNGSVVIYSNSTRLNDSGIYYCRYYEYINHTKIWGYSSASLTVYESEPYCETNYAEGEKVVPVEEDRLWMKCRVRFTGFWAPVMEWKRHSLNDSETDDEELEYNGEMITENNTGITSILSILFVVNNFPQRTYFSCVVNFKPQNDSHLVKATNLPDFKYTWKFPEIDPVTKSTIGKMNSVSFPVPVMKPLTDSSQTTKQPWFFASIGLIVFVLIVVFLAVGIIFRRIVLQIRRIRGFPCHPSTSSSIRLRNLERPSSGLYDVIPNTSPNIYNHLEEPTEPNNSCYSEPFEVQSYTGLNPVLPATSSPYDNLHFYLVPTFKGKKRKFSTDEENDASEEEEEDPLRYVEEPRLFDNNKDDRLHGNEYFDMTTKAAEVKSVGSDASSYILPDEQVTSSDRNINVEHVYFNIK